MRHLFTLLAIPFFLFSIVSCEDDNFNNIDTSLNSTTTTTYTANLNGASVVPTPIDSISTATGTAELIFDNSSKTFKVSVTHSITTPISGQIYIGETDVIGKPFFTFTDFISPITYFASDPLTESQEEDLKSSLFYIVIQSTAFPLGEIRGQFIFKSISDTK